MIEQRSLSLDEEAALYSAAFFHKDPTVPAPGVLRSASLSRAPSACAAARPVCYRCGAAGHLSFACAAALAPLAELERAVDADIERIVAAKRGAPGMRADEFGLFCADAAAPLPAERSWRTASFCANCGAAGHREKRCPRPPFQRIASDMRDALAPHSRCTAADVEALFRELWR
jgi:hypothetical protein